MEFDFPKNLDVIIHVGAGDCRELTAYCESDAKKIVLVEPNPALAESLRQKADRDVRIVVREAAISDASAPRILVEYNLPEASSLYEPSALRQLFPGLRTINQHQVSVLSPSQLIQECCTPDDSILLIIRAPGAEQSILYDLVQSHTLHQVNAIYLYASYEPYYEQGMPAESLIELLQQQGYSLDDVFQKEADWPLWKLTCSPFLRQLESMEKANHLLNESLADRQKKLEQALADNRQEKVFKHEYKLGLENANRHLAEKEHELAESNARVQELQTWLGERDQALDSLRQEFLSTRSSEEKLSEEVNNLRSKNHEVEQLLDNARKALEENQAEQEKTKEHAQNLIGQLNQTRQQLDASQDELEIKRSEYQALQTLLDERNTECEQLKKQIAQARDENDKLAKESAQNIEQLTEQLNKHKEQLNQRKEQLAQHQKNQEEKQKELDTKNGELQVLQARLDERENQLKALNEQFEALKEQYQQLGANLESKNTEQQAKLEALNKRMEYLFGQQTLQLEQAANALGRHVTNMTQTTARELEAGIALQQQYGQELPSLEEQGSKLPASVALQLSRQLKAKPYDLIIEVGSGVTTSFIAHTLRNHSGAATNSQNSADTQVSRYVDPSEDDLPKRIVCFEHNRAAYNKLQDALKNSGLAPLISLQFSPLVPHHHQGEETLFYDCAGRLQQIAQLFEHRQARIFILLNQPLGDSQPHLASALPIVLRYLSAHTLDVVVNTQGDFTLLQSWQKLLNERGLEYSEAREFGNNQVHLLTINP